MGRAPVHGYGEDMDLLDYSLLQGFRRECVIDSGPA